MGKKVGITYDLKTDWVKNPDEPVDINAELDSPETIDRIAQALEKGGHTVKRIGNVQKLLFQIDRLDVDIVFNIAEGRRGRNRESQVPMILEMYNIPCVGADALCLGITLDKYVTKKMMVADGIPTPRFFSANTTDDMKALNTIGYPLIVKTRHEGTSKGLTKSSRVTNLQELKKQVGMINKQYHQPALVEEFIKGTEFTVPVLGNDAPVAMPVLQVIIDGNTNLGDDFYTFEYVSYHGLQYVCPAKISSALTKQLQDLAVRTYRCVECRDFGRVDFRVDEKGNLYVLEINPLPSLAKNDAFNIFPTVIGADYTKVINEILNFGLQRYGLCDKFDSEVLHYKVRQKSESIA
jgi:D-alanine-D-alanine ligase